MPAEPRSEGARAEPAAPGRSIEERGGATLTKIAAARSLLREIALEAMDEPLPGRPLRLALDVADRLLDYVAIEVAFMLRERGASLALRSGDGRSDTDGVLTRLEAVAFIRTIVERTGDAFFGAFARDARSVRRTLVCDIVERCALRLGVAAPEERSVVLDAMLDDLARHLDDDQGACARLSTPAIRTEIDALLASYSPHKGGRSKGLRSVSGVAARLLIAIEADCVRGERDEEALTKSLDQMLARRGAAFHAHTPR